MPSLPRSPPRILFIQAEKRRWLDARTYPWCLHFAFEEALRGQGAEMMMITTPWLPQLSRLVAGRTFDQVWINDLTHYCDFHHDIARLRDLAPVRVGLITESVFYAPEEYADFPWLNERSRSMGRQIEGVTHVAAVDEVDVQRIHGETGKPTCWLPCSIPEAMLARSPLPAPRRLAYFSGTPYGARQRWLDEPRLQPLLAYQPSTNSPESVSVPFDRLPGHRITSRLLPFRSLYSRYLEGLRKARREAAELWLAGMREGCAVVNLPHLVKGYSSRVIEGLASGRPVISWEIPERPWNTTMFEDGREILLYRTPDELARHIERVLDEPVFAERIAAQALAKVRALHTTERRVQQMLRWIESGSGVHRGPLEPRAA